MKNLLVISLSLFFLLPVARPQERSNNIISGTYNNLPFDEFAKQVKEQYNITIFYESEWIEDITVTVSGDSIPLATLLNRLLKPKGVHFFDKKNGQIFITGNRKIDDSALRKLIISREEPDSVVIDDNRILSSVSYEKRVNMVRIGKADEREASGNSLLSGRVTSSSSGEPVIGATIYVKGTNKGVITNTEGFYALQVDAGSSITLNVSCLGMEKETYFVVINSSGVLNIEMSEMLVDIQEVLVRSGKHENVRGIQMGFQRIAIKEIKTVPVVMGERDILKVASMLPGVHKVGEGAAGLNVRGSSSDQNLFLVNEIPVFNTGHLFGFFSAFNPDMVSDFNLYKSNFPAEYGGRLASVFEVSTRKGNKKKFGARGGINPITGSLLVETPVVNDKVSVIFGGRSTYSDWILNRIKDKDIQSSYASFYDLMSGIHILPDDKSSLQIFGYYSKDKFTLAGTNDYRYENRGSSIMYNRQLNEGWKLELAGVVSQYRNYRANRDIVTSSYEHEFLVNYKELKAKITGLRFINQRISFGGNFIIHNLNHGIYQPMGNESLISAKDFGKEKGIEYAFYLSDEYKITDNLTLYGGLRYSLFNYLGPKDIYSYANGLPRELTNITDTTSYTKGESIANYNCLEYRMSLNYELHSDLSLKMSFNRMRQYIFMLSNTIAISPTDRWKLADLHITPPIANHVSFGVYKNYNKSAIETSAEFYYKKTKDIVEYKDGADLTINPYFETSILQGDQNSWGAEFLVKRNAGRFTGWMSYAYSRSLISVDSEDSWDQINNGITYAANYDKPHSLNFVGNYRFSRRFSLASNLVYSTGRPITYPTGIFYINGIEGISYSNRNEYRIPDYFRIDVSINFEGNLLKRKLAHGSWMFALYNVTGRKNAYSIYFKNEGGRINGYKQSIYGVPIFTISYNFKLGNYAVE